MMQASIVRGALKEFVEMVQTISFFVCTKQTELAEQTSLRAVRRRSPLLGVFSSGNVYLFCKFISCYRNCCDIIKLIKEVFV